MATIRVLQSISKSSGSSMSRGFRSYFICCLTGESRQNPQKETSGENDDQSNERIRLDAGVNENYPEIANSEHPIGEDHLPIYNSISNDIPTENNTSKLNSTELSKCREMLADIARRELNDNETGNAHGSASPQSSNSQITSFGSESTATTVGNYHDANLGIVMDRRPELRSQCAEVDLTITSGILEVTCWYERQKSLMNVTIHRVQDIPSKDRGSANYVVFHLVLLPSKKVKHKTKAKPNNRPEFEESFQFKVTLDDLATNAIRFRLYGCERLQRGKLIGETTEDLDKLIAIKPSRHLLHLRPRSNMNVSPQQDDDSHRLRTAQNANNSLLQSPRADNMCELLVGLCYNLTTGRLQMDIVKGSNFNRTDRKAPDTYVKLSLISMTGRNIGGGRTSGRNGQPNPVFKETFMFQVPESQLPNITVLVSVYDKKGVLTKDLTGWFSLGYNSSGIEEMSHWNDMRLNPGDNVTRWHALLED